MRSTFYLIPLLIISLINNSTGQSIHNIENFEQKLEQKLSDAIKNYDQLDDATKQLLLNDNWYFNPQRNASEIAISTLSTSESEVHAAINPTDTNNIVVSPIQQSSLGLNCPVYYTKDFGQTWSKSLFTAKTPNVLIAGGGDPNFAFDKNGRCYLSWINLYLTLPARDSLYWGMYWAYSDDGGANWVVPNNNIIALDGAVYSTPLKLNFMYDKQWMAVDQTNGTYSNDLYLVMYEVDFYNGKYKIVMRKKDADSNHFTQESINVSDSTFKFVQFSCIDIDKNGYIHATFYGSKDSIDYSLWHSISKNGGQSFETPVKISNIHIADYIPGIKNSRLYPCPYFTIDKSSSIYNGNIYISWTADGINNNELKGANVYFSKSIDNGQTWSTPIVVESNPKGEYRDKFYSSITVNPEGKIALSYYDGRNATQNKNVFYMMSYSFDGGESFKNEFYISQDSTDFSTVGQKTNGFGIGEYNELLSTNGYAIPVWADGRKNNGDLDIYAAFIEFNQKAAGTHRISNFNNNLGNITIYPNPVTDQLNYTIQLKTQTEVLISIISEDGKEIMIGNKQLSSGLNTLNYNTNKLSNGSYHLIIKDGNRIVSKSFVKK